MTVVVVTAGANTRAKLQLNCHHQQTNTQFFYRMDSLPITQPSVKALTGNNVKALEDVNTLLRTQCIAVPKLLLTNLKYYQKFTRHDGGKHIIQDRLKPALCHLSVQCACH